MTTFPEIRQFFFAKSRARIPNFDGIEFVQPVGVPGRTPSRTLRAGVKTHPFPQCCEVSLPLSLFLFPSLFFSFSLAILSSLFSRTLLITSLLLLLYLFPSLLHIFLPFSCLISSLCSFLSLILFLRPSNFLSSFPLFFLFLSFFLPPSLSLYGEYQNREFDGSGWDETVRDGMEWGRVELMDERADG